MNITVIATSTEKIKCATIFVQDSVNDNHNNGDVDGVDDSEPTHNVFIDDSARDDDDDDDDDDDGDDDDVNVVVEEPRMKNKQRKRNTIKFIDSLAFLNSSLDNLSSMLEGGDKRNLDEYLTYKCLRKFRSKEEVDLLYEGRVRHGDELQQLMNERVRNHIPFNKLTDILPMDNDDYRNKVFVEMSLTEMEQTWKARAIELVTKKGVFPYSWFDNINKTEYTHPPSQEDIYDDLSKQHISDEKYQHMLDVWTHFEFNNFGEYMEMYMEVDVILLQCVVEKFRTEAAGNYSDLDPMR